MSKIILNIIKYVCISLAIFHLYAAGVKILPPLQQRSIHIGLALVIIFLLYPLINKKRSINEEEEIKNSELSLAKRHPIEYVVNFLLVFISLGTMIYIYFNHIELLKNLNNPSELTFYVGLIMIILVLEATRRTIGWTLPILSVVAIIYAMYGDRLPLLFRHSGYTFEEVITKLGTSNIGIFGQPLGISATYIILYVIFGSLLSISGAGKLFIDLAMALVGKFRGGAAKVSVVSSALAGTISGNPVSNVVTTGVLTIPLMKKQGYDKNYAAAVETVSSTGGILLPPIMGAVAFLVADFVGVEYSVVALAAIIPAILYFIAIFIMVDLNAAKMEKNGTLVRSQETYNVKELLLKQGHLLIPIFVLLYFLLIQGSSPILSAFWSIISIPIVSYFQKETRLTLSKISDALQEGVKLSLMVITACACAGIIMGIIDLTGVGLRFAGILTDLAGGNLFFLLILTMVSSIILGMGLPPVAAYLILAIIVAPALTNMGVSLMAAHMFIFYYGTLSVITPPVAIAAFAASSLASSNPNKTAFLALRLGSTAFIIPFFFVYGPELLLEGDVVSIVIASITALLGIFALSVALEGFIKDEVSLMGRILMGIAALCLMNVGIISDLVGGVISVSVIIWQIKKSRRAVLSSEVVN